MVFRIRRCSESYPHIRRRTHVHIEIEMIRGGTIYLYGRRYEPVISNVYIVGTKLHKQLILFPEPTTFIQTVISRISVIIHIYICIIFKAIIFVIKIIVEKRIGRRTVCILFLFFYYVPVLRHSLDYISSFQIRPVAGLYFYLQRAFKHIFTWGGGGGGIVKDFPLP